MSGETRSDLTVVEICAGAGGQSLGLHLAGFRHTLAVELDEDAAATLDRNLRRLADDEGLEQPKVAIGDVADESVWSPEEHRGVSLLAGGVPCPPFSIAGQQKGAEDERDLFAWAVEAAGRMEPDAILLENVRGLSMPRFAGYRQAVLDRLAELGYKADWRLLEARDFGVPQLRPRFILVALKEEFAPYFAWPEPSETAPTVGEALKPLMAASGWRGATAWAKKANRIAPTIVGGSKKHGGPDLGPTRAKHAWMQLSVDGFGVANEAPTKDTPANYVPKLTNEMIARLQGWHQDRASEYYWDFAPARGKKTTIYRQIGNAFPPPVARAVGESIAAALRKTGDAKAPTDGDAPEFHDEVYKALRERRNFVSLAGLSRDLGNTMPTDEIERRITFLSRDFEITTGSRGGRTTYKLGEWRAFRGQSDHSRHLSFIEKQLRARIS
ncbi:MULTISPECIES: DNA cytosine methyltransferase [Tsukamurella]|uniref:Cytosine-specific methyltransferase n=2 Tax=Tsukamurella TaxID=2060 RepID=A0A5C5RV97_9ACTN|nr:MULTISPECIES: DNA (cytosine-5-)-methyltransferase [Tsukamurella]NMD56339.1 DNA cytosine methyltransferase [Tsukamurella columbiensis]TWS26959.1 DNA cytosine methyltransferase [Tsukamurella conjunctivitidis]